jgi:hypothetical protein
MLIRQNQRKILTWENLQNSKTATNMGLAKVGL